MVFIRGRVSVPFFALMAKDESILLIFDRGSRNHESLENACRVVGRYLVN